MHPRFAQLPSALRARATITRLADNVPVLLAHPTEGWADDAPPEPRAAPLMLWFHGRTANKELDPGRYLRWVRAGIGACAVDLPGHGERAIDGWDDSDHTLRVAAQAVDEVDRLVDAIEADPKVSAWFDTSRIGIGGMSAGGMVTLARLCARHHFRCAAVESTAGDWSAMAGTDFAQEPWFTSLDPGARLAAWRPIPVLALHSEADQTVPFAAMSGFIERLRAHYTLNGADPDLVELKSWPKTGAPSEHAGFGRVANEAKNTQVGFLTRWLGA
ncbi:MAG: prolyl oligopeptidase family serine peptidase [Planctomycetota bacterium]